MTEQPAGNAGSQESPAESHAGQAPAAAPTAGGTKAAAKQATAKRAAPKQVAAKKATATKTTAKKTAGKQATAKRAAAKQVAARLPSPPTTPEPAAKAPGSRAPAAKAPGNRAPAAKAPGAKRAPAAKAAAKKALSTAATAAEGASAKPDLPPAPARNAAGTPAASAADVARARTDNRLAQVLYHDWESGHYDAKWSISFDERCISYARDRFAAVIGPEVLRAEPWPYREALEIGAGTGFFSLNLRQAGVLDRVTISDISAGMVDTAEQTARRLGFQVDGVVSAAESLPFPDGTFDIVVGHAVLHHIPDVEAALREVLRVLKPGGRFVIAGEPSRIGDRYARQLGRLTWRVTTRVTQLRPLRERWARSHQELHESSRAAALESVVDLHTFVPGQLAAMAERAGAADVRTETEELLAAFVGWPVRTFEAAVNPDRLGWGWAMFAYRTWQRLSAVDRLLAHALPQGVFYNVGITGTKPRG